MRGFSVSANSRAMEGLKADTKLINDLAAWARKAPSRMAQEAGLAATTLTRPANGSATTRLGRVTLDALRRTYPDWPGWHERAPGTNVKLVQFEGASFEEAPENLPVFGTGLGAARVIEGEAIEQTTLNRGEVIEYVKRPAILKRQKNAYALYVQGSSMHPALPDGEMIVAVKDAPLGVGDNVVVYLRIEDELDDGVSARAVLVKELVRRTASYVELRQYSPAMDFRIDMSEVLRIDRVLTRREMLS